MVAIDDATNQLKKERLALKVIDGPQDYFSYKVRLSGDKKQAWL